MFAAAILKPRTTAVVHSAIPRPGPREVAIRIEGCGLCASSLPVWEGRSWFKYPLAPGEPGHEAWGTIESVGSDAVGFAAGDRVAMVSYRSLAEFDTARADAVIRLPEVLRESPFPGEALGCTMNIFARSDIRKGHTVAIIGIGFIGALLCRLAVAAGARVIAVSRRPFALSLARSFGAHQVCELKNDIGTVARTIMAETNATGCERVLEVAGLQTTLDLATEAVAEGGRLVIAGYHQDGIRRVRMQQWNWRGIDVVNAHERSIDAYMRGMQAAVEAVASGTLDPSALYTHTFDLDQVDKAFELMERRPDGFLKALIAT